MKRRTLKGGCRFRRQYHLVITFCLAFFFVSTLLAAHAVAGFDMTVFGPKRYDRLKGAPNVYNDTFRSCDPSDLALLRVTNGNGKDTSITAGEISVNGTVVVTESEFKNQTLLIEKPISVQQTNTLQVVLKSSSRETSFVIIEIIGRGCDSTPPEIFAPIPADGAVLNDPRPAIGASYRDAAEGSGIDPASARLTVDVVDVTAAASVTSTGIVYHPTGDLSYGVHTAYVTVADRAGNHADATWHFSTDTVPPSFKVTYPANGQYLNIPRITITGTIDDPNTTLTFGGRAAVVQGNNFTVPDFLLVEGKITIPIVAKDAVGNSASDTLTVILDTIPPELHIDSPTDNSSVNTPVIAVSGTVDDANPATVTVNGIAATVVGRNFSLNELPLQEGLNLVTAVATDAAGNTTTVSVKVIRDTVPPVVSVTAPLLDAWVNTPVITVSGSVIEKDLVSLTVNGVETPVGSDGLFSLGNVPLIEGRNVISVLALDRAGNETLVNVPVNLDTVPPEVKINTPPNGLLTNNGQVTVSGTVSEELTAVTVNGVTAETVGKEFTLGYTLKEGENVLLARATDRARNAGTATVTVYLDSKPPAPPGFDAVNVPANAATVTLTGTAEAHATVTISSGAGVVGTVSADAQGKFLLAEVALKEGANTFTATATDEAKNQSAPSAPLTVNRPPVFNPLADQSINEGATLSVAIAASDHDGDRITLSAGQLPAFASFKDNGDGTGTLTATPVFPQAGSYSVGFTATDGKGGTAYASLNLTVVHVNRPPVITTLTLPGGRVDQQYVGTVAASDPDGDTLAFSLLAGPTGMTIDPASGALSWKPSLSDIRSYQLTVSVSDGKGGSDIKQYTLLVPDTIPPSVSLNAPKEAIPGSTLTLVIDAADNIGVTSVTLTVDGTQVKSFAAPPYSHQLTLPALIPIGSKVALKATALDAAGNSADASATVTIVGVPDTTPPTVSLKAPPTVTPGTKITLAASATDDQGVALLTFFQDGQKVGEASPSQSSVEVTLSGTLQVGAEINFSVTATDFSGNSASDQAKATVIGQADTTPPVVSLTAPATVQLGQKISATAQVSDDTGVALVEIYLDHTKVLTFPSGGTLPIQLDAPQGAVAGTQSLIEVRALDFAGNENRDSKSVTLVAAEVRQGLVTGAVYDDATGLPLAGATASLVMDGKPEVTAFSDARGRYSFVADEGSGRISVTKSGYTRVDRPRLSVVINQGRRVPDARLTPLGTGNTKTVAAVLGDTLSASFTPSGAGIDSALKRAGISASSATLSLTLAPGALTADRELTLTQVGAQGLQGRLPNGWSPLAAFDLYPHGVSLTAPQQAAVPNLFGTAVSGTMVLARWDEGEGTWRVAGQALPSAGGSVVTAQVAATGEYALVLADQALNLTELPAAGALLPAADLAQVPQDAAALVTPQPKIIFYKPGVKSEVGTQLSPGTALVSGQGIWGNIAEQYDFYSGERLVGDPFDQDIVLYGFGLSGAPLLADYQVSPSLPFGGNVLKIGTITVTAAIPASDADTLAVIGPNGGSIPGPTGESLTFPAGAVEHFVPVFVKPFSLTASGLVLPDGFQFLGGITLSLNGNQLNQPALLSIPAPSGFSGDGTLLLVKAVGLPGRTSLALAGVAKLDSGRIVSSYDLLGDGAVKFPGISGDGRYLMLQTAKQLGYSIGQVTGTDGSPFTGALIACDNTPLVAFSRAPAGSYTAAVGAGAFNISATDLVKMDRSTASGTVAVNAFVQLDLSLKVEPPAVVSVTPAADTVDVALADPVKLRFSRPLDPATVLPAAFTLTAPTGPVTCALSLSADGMEATLRPADALEPKTVYTVGVATTVRDLAGNAMVAPFSSSFTTLDTNPPPAPPAGTVNASIPTAGNTTVTATQGTAGLHDTVYIINQSTGAKNQVQVEPNGGFTVTMPADVKDRLQIEITNPGGATTTVALPRFQETQPDGSLKAVVGSEGGRIALPSGLYLDVPSGAFSDGDTVRVKDLSQTDLGIPDMPGSGYQFVAGFEISTSTPQQKYLNVSVPAPAGYDPSVPGIVAMMDTAAGEPIYSVVDTAKLIGGRLATSSPPCPGILSMYGRYAMMLVNAPGGNQVNQLKNLGMAILSMTAPRVKSYVVQPMTISEPLSEQYLGGGFWNNLLSLNSPTSTSILNLQPASIFMAKVQSATSVSEVNNAIISTIGGDSQQLCLPVPGNTPITVVIRDASNGQVIQTQTVNPTAAGQSQQIALSITDPFDTTRPQIIMTSWDGLNILDTGTPITIYFSKPVRLGATEPVYLMTTGSQPQKVTGKALLDSSSRLLQFIPDKTLALGQTFELHLADVKDNAGNQYQDDPIVGPRTFKTYLPVLLWQTANNLLTRTKTTADLGLSYPVSYLSMKDIEFKTVPPDESTDGLWHTTLYGTGTYGYDYQALQLMTVDFSKPMEPKALSFYPSNYQRNYNRIRLLKDVYLKPRTPSYTQPQEIQNWSQRVLNYVDSDPTKRICIDPNGDSNILTKWQSKYCPLGTACSTKSGGCGDLLLETSYNTVYSDLLMFDLSNPAKILRIGHRMLGDDSSILCSSSGCPRAVNYAPQGLGITMGVAGLTGIDISHNRRGLAPSTYVNSDSIGAYAANYGLGLAMVDLGLNIPEIMDSERDFPTYSVPTDFETMGTFPGPYYRDVGILRGKVVAVAGDNSDGSGVMTIEVFAPDFTSKGMAPLPYIAKELTTVENLYQSKDATGNLVQHDMAFITSSGGGLTMVEVNSDGTIGGMDTFVVPPGTGTRHVEVDKDAMTAYVSGSWTDDSGRPVVGILMANLAAQKSVVNGWDSRYFAKIPFTAPDSQHTITSVYDFRLDLQRRFLYAGIDMAPADSGQIPFAALKLSAVALDGATIKDATLDPSSVTNNFPSSDGMLAGILTTDLDNSGRVCVDLNISNTTGQQMTYTASERPLVPGQPTIIDFSRGNSGDLTNRLCFDRNAEPQGSLPYPTVLQIDIQSGGQFVRRLFVRLQPASIIGKNAKLTTILDRSNKQSNAGMGATAVYFGLTYDAKVTIKIDGDILDLTGVIGADNPVKFDNYPLPAGMQKVDVAESLVPEPGEHSLEITAVFNDSPEVRDVFNGVIDHEIQILDRFPLGHTLVKGVDISGGQVSLQRTDLVLPAVGPGLQFSRIYSSAGSDSAGPIGAGWSHNYQSRLTTGPLGTYVIGGEGSGIRFTKVAGKYQPQAGFHGSLTDNGDGTFDFYAKTRTRYHYKASYDPALATGTDRVYNLDYIQDPHGNRTEVHYNSAAPYNISEVVEKPLDLQGSAVPETDLRKLVFTYATGKTGADGTFTGYGNIPEERITKVEVFKGSNSLGIELDYDYDQYGNLTKATRDVKSEQYDYYDTDPNDRHNIKQVTDPNQYTVQYNYYANTDHFPGENVNGTLGQPLLAFPNKNEYMKNLVEGSGTEQVTTGYVYDYSQYQQNKVVTNVSTGLSNATPPTQTFVTFYTMNTRGNVVQTTVPGGNSDGSDNIAYSKWSSDLGIADVYVKEQTDGAGRKTVFDYDGNGNLVGETVNAPSSGNYAAVNDGNGNAATSVITTYTYDSCSPTFNKVATFTDREGNVTTNQIECAAGDLLSVTKSGPGSTRGLTTSYTYWPNGLLKTSTDANNNVTSYTAYKYGEPESILAPQGLVITDRHDDRGRLTDHSDNFGRHTAYTVYDNLDRLKHSIQYSGDVTKEPDFEVEIEYYPGGEKKTVSSGITTTSYALDTLNRVKSESVNVKDADSNTTTLTTSYAFDANGNRTYQKDRRGIETWVDYDLMDRQVAVKVRNPQTGTLVPLDHAKSYDPAGNLISVTDLHGFTTTLTSDWLYRTTTTTLPGGTYKVVKSYDRIGNVLSLTDANGKKTVMTYDFMNRLLTTTDPVGRSLHHSYDDNGNLVKTEHQTGAGVTELVERQDPFDGLNRPTASYREFKDPLSGQQVSYKTSYTYDDAHNTKRIKNETRGIVTVEKYNGLEKLLERTVAEGSLNLKTTFTYDANGNVATVTDPQSTGPGVTTSYDALNRKIASSFVQTPDDSGPITEKSYFDGAGNLVKSVDKRGITTRSEYDFLGRPTKKYLVESISNNGAELLAEETQYDDAANKVYVWDANRNKTERDYNGLHQEVKTVDPLGNSIISTYDGVSKLSETDRQGIKTSFDYDDVNRLVVTHEYDLAGNEASRLKTDYLDDLDRRVDYDRYTGTTPSSLQTITQLDPLGRVRQVSKKHADLASRYGSDTVTAETTAYDENGNKVRVTNANGHVTSLVYDDADRLAQKVEGDGTADAGTTTYSYDKVGNLLTVKGPRNNGSTFDLHYTYDARYRKKTEENANNEITTYTYDAMNNTTGVKKPKGHLTSYAYDEVGKLLAVDETAGSAGAVTRYAYDANRNRTAQQDANNNLSTYVYDALNRLTDTYQHQVAGTLAAGSPRGSSQGGNTATALHWQSGYDKDGNQNLIIDAKGQRVDLTYDHLNRLATRSYSNPQPGHDGQPVFLQPQGHTYGYDLNGNLLSVEEKKKYNTGETSDQVTTQTFDPLNRLETRTNTDKKKLSFTYDKQGNRASVTDSDGNTTTYQYNAREWLSGMSTGLSQTTTYAYYPDGLPKKTSYPNGTFEDMDLADAYDASGRLTHRVNHKGNVSDPISQYAYHYDANGNRDYQDEQHKQLGITTPVRTTYTYDSLDRLSKVDYGNGSAITYTYDNVGNRLTEQGNDPKTLDPVNREYAYDRLNRLQTVKNNANPAASVVYEYDADGNTVSRNTGQIDPATGTIADTSGKEYYDYDVRDKMSLVTSGQTKTADFDYDYLGMRIRKTGNGYAIIYLYDQKSVLQEYDSATLATTRKYNYGTALHSLVAGGKTNYYLLDGLRSTSEITDDTGAIVDSYQYDAWGGTRQEYSLLDNDRKFTGHYLDKETGLHYFGARYYDDKTGRFLNQDPYEGDMNNPPSLHRYMYANDNPLIYVDENGNSATLTGTLLGFAWGVGQAFGDMINARVIDPLVSGNLKKADSWSFGGFLNTVAQNTIAGFETGLSIDVAALSGGAASMASGALGGAGFEGFTFQGKAADWSQFAESQEKGAKFGLLFGAVGEIASPILKGVGKGVEWIAEKTPLGAISEKAMTALSEGLESTLSKGSELGGKALKAIGYEESAAAARIENALSSAWKEMPAGTGSNAARSAESIATRTEAGSAAERVALETEVTSPAVSETLEAAGTGSRGLSADAVEDSASIAASSEKPRIVRFGPQPTYSEALPRKQLIDRMQAIVDESAQVADDAIARGDRAVLGEFLYPHQVNHVLKGSRLASSYRGQFVEWRSRLKFALDESIQPHVGAGGYLGMRHVTGRGLRRAFADFKGTSEGLLPNTIIEVTTFKQYEEHLKRLYLEKALFLLYK
ncbi:MAG TPA: Ig-like domain-containing protein [Geobacteraceae bacterium]